MRPYNRRKEQKILKDIRDRFNNNPPKPKPQYEGRNVYEKEKMRNVYFLYNWEIRDE